MKPLKMAMVFIFSVSLTACGTSRVTTSKVTPNGDERQLVQNHWIIQLDELFRQHKLSQDYNPNPPTFTEVVQANIDIMVGRATVIDKLPTLGVLDLSVPKIGIQTHFTFENRGTDINDMPKRSQTDILTDPKNGDITEIYVSSGGSTFNVKDLDVSKLNLVFMKYAFDESKYEDSVQYSLSKIFTVKDNPKVRVTFLRNYQDGTCSCVHEKAQYDYDKSHVKQLQKYGMVKISLQ